MRKIESNHNQRDVPNVDKMADLNKRHVHNWLENSDMPKKMDTGFRTEQEFSGIVMDE